MSEYMTAMYLEALEEARKDRAELSNLYFNLAVSTGQLGDVEKANEYLRVALDQDEIAKGLERNVRLLKGEA